MGRRRKTELELLIKAASLLPWWLALTFATISYGLIHLIYLHFSGQAVARKCPSALGPKLQDSIWSAVALFAQWVVPMVLLLGAVVSVYGRWQAGTLFAAASASMDNIQHMRWQEFERLIAEAFLRQGYRVQETGVEALTVVWTSSCPAMVSARWCNASTGKLDRWELRWCARCMAS